MKQLLLVFTLFCFSLNLAGQPSEFAPAPCNNDVFAVMFYQSFLGQVDGNPIEPGVDWVAAIDAQGYVVGVEQVSSISGFGCPSLPAVSLQIDGESTSPGAGCPAPPYGGAFNEAIDIVLYDVSRDLFFSLASSIPYVNNTTPGTANPSGMCMQEDFTVPYTIPTNPLPVILTAFRGQANDRGQVNLGWTTIAEQNSDYFGIEHSSNGEAWRTIGQVTAAGNNSGERHYDFTDETPNSGQNLYRLRQVDFDGSYYYSSVVSVNLEDLNGPKEVEVFPNPIAGNQISVSLRGSWNGEATASLYDMNGRQVATWFNLVNGSNTVDIPQLPAGIYQLTTTDSADQQSVRVIIK